MSEGRLSDDTPFDDFEVEPERMADGRTIHYYVWPERPAAEEDGADAGARAVPPEGPADV